MRFLLFLLSLLFLVELSLHAQESPGLRDVIVDSTNYIPVNKYRNIGVAHRTTRDEALSPLVFQGFGAAFSASSWKYNNHWLWQNTFGSHLHLLNNGPGSSVINDLGFSYHVAALKELRPSPQRKWHFWVGPEARMMLNMRLHSRNTNNVASYDWATSLGASAMLSRRFSLFGRTFAISNQLQLPLFFVYARPPFAWGVPPAVFEEQEGAWKEAFQIGTLNNIFFVSNQFNLDFYLRKRKKKKLVQYKAYRISYTWNYYEVATINSLQTGGHQLSLSRVITF